MGSVKRLFVEKKKGCDVAASGLLYDLRENLGIKGLTGVRILNRYDIEGISEQEYIAARNTIFAEPPVDLLYDENVPLGSDEKAFAIEYLPGQYDQRADSASQCIQLLTHGNRPTVATAQVFVLQGNISDDEFLKIKKYCINPVDSREAAFDKPESLEMKTEIPEDVKVLGGFIHYDESQLEQFRISMGLAMRLDDLLFCQKYFRDNEKRDPTITEIRMLDTYWSDHCRHTTFLTAIDDVHIEEGVFSEPLKIAFSRYKDARQFVYGNYEMDISLMDLATIGAKELKKRGLLDDLDSSEEINACSIVVPVEIDGKEEEWLVMFKNET